MSDFEEDKSPENIPPWENRNAWIAILFGSILLFAAYSHSFEKYKIAEDAFHEIGFALIVAVFIWAIFELASGKETERSWNKRIDRITKNVFFGVLGNNLSKEFINEARIVAIEHDFERRDFHVTYRLAEKSYVDSNGQTVDFVTLRVTGVFKIKNISTQTKTYNVGVGLPNPLVDEMKPFCQIHGASVTDNTGTVELSVIEANKTLVEKLKDDKLYLIYCGIEDIGMVPGEEIEVSIEYTMSKESEDTEILQTKYPTSSIVINLVDTGIPKRAVRARSIHRVPIKVDSSGSADGCYVYRISTPLLPYQGFAIFWKKVPVRPALAPPPPLHGLAPSIEGRETPGADGS